MNPVSTYLLEKCFWNHVDAGLSGNQSPLMTGSFEGKPLVEILGKNFGISRERAEFEIQAARHEVEL